MVSRVLQTTINSIIIHIFNIEKKTNLLFNKYVFFLTIPLILISNEYVDD